MLAETEVASKLAIELWRLRGKLSDAAPSVIACLDRMSFVLQEHGITVVDPSRQPYSHGLTIDVIEWEEHDELEPFKPIIGETITPIVYVGDKIFKQAQVIVHIHSRDEV